MSVDLFEIRRKTVSASQYIEKLEQPFKDRYLTIKQAYRLQIDAVRQLKRYGNRLIVIVFSAAWCKDCAESIPVLALIEEETSVEVRVFGSLKKDPLSHTSKWRIPPSPSEVVAFGVDQIPLMVVVNSEGREVGRIVERHKHWPTLEQELCEMIKLP